MKATGGTIFKRHISALEPPYWYIISPPFTCVLGLEQEVRSRDLYATYSVWCSQNGEKELSQRELTSKLIDRGDITRKRLGHGGDRGLKGVALISERQSDPWASVLGASALADTDTW